jgi:hypothetical protein
MSFRPKTGSQLPMAMLGNVELKVGQLVLAGRKNPTLLKKLPDSWMKLKLRQRLKLIIRLKKRKLSRRIISMNWLRIPTKNPKTNQESGTTVTQAT